MRCIHNVGIGNDFYLSLNLCSYGIRDHKIIILIKFFLLYKKTHNAAIFLVEQLRYLTPHYYRAPFNTYSWWPLRTVFIGLRSHSQIFVTACSYRTYKNILEYVILQFFYFLRGVCDWFWDYMHSYKAL